MAAAVVDLDSLKEKYAQERNKRLRPDAADQYRQVDEGVLHHYADDPYTEPVTRDPILDRECDFLVIGAGFTGQLVAIRLLMAGITDICIVDKAGDFGGTWYWNRYPGAACDVESYIYLPLLEETGYMPSERYAKGPEIFAYAKRLAAHYGLYEKALFQTEVLKLEWNEQEKLWIVSTNRGDRLRAKFVASTSGPLHKPKLPGVKGIDTFAGHSFHASRWNYQYTGGDATGGLHKLQNKCVGIVGTGATAIQVVPHLAAAAKHLYVFQRTPSTVSERLDGPTDPEWVASLTPGWQQRRMDNFNAITSLGHEDEDLVQDGWTAIFREIARLHSEAPAMPLDDAIQLADVARMEQIRARIDRVVNDPVTANNLKPWYSIFCKRMCFHDDYLQTFNRPNVTLVDTAGEGIERVTPAGIVAQGEEYKLDCIIFATGFDVAGGLQHNAVSEIRGRHGRTLQEHWAEGPRLFHGLLSHGFPNCFFVGPVQTGLGANVIHMLNEQARHVAYIVAEARSRQNARTVEVSAEAEENWVQMVVEVARSREKYWKECTPGFFNHEGKLDSKTLKRGIFGGGALAFLKLKEDWKREGKLAGLELDGSRSS
ncbi:hypothetical protein VTN96DRAFT_930 [Rasamsonia emersonii]|uniref:Cyclohexanone monooxygenase n=1 Tax=Rasamsonia emersonii (strain ATCC 16479 / CBS 393.64 / IMI 116815) TaxID=1408163 RepID=A0A0F4YLQ2_RASE3|nr:Cyclohexanone monooxygenase [Rasamsonia emersonii CBS 393.64]KKA19144.1 Cyclohexanone monooxygenase [Rasamsonia emersonii CBS 393.64]